MGDGGTARGPAPTAARAALSAVLTATFVVRFAFGAALAVFASYLLGATEPLSGGTAGVVGAVSALSPLAEFSTVLSLGWIADRVGRLRLLFAATTAAALLLALAGATRSPYLLGAVNAGFGVSSGGILASSLAVVGDVAAPDERGYRMGWFDAMNLAGWIVGFAAGFALLGLLPNARLPWVFDLAAGLLVIGAVRVALARGSEAPLPGRRPRLIETLRRLARPDAFLVLAPWFVIYLLIGTAFVFLGLAASGIGISPLYLALGIGLGGAGLVLTQPSYGRWADRWGTSRLMTIGALGFTAVMVEAAAIVSFGPRPPLLAALGASILIALTYGPAALSALAEYTRAADRAASMGLYTLTISLGMFVGLLGSTGLYDGFGAAGLDGFFGAVAGGLVALTVARWRRERVTPRVR